MLSQTCVKNSIHSGGGVYTHTHLARHTPGRHPPPLSRRPPQRTVRILLECILVCESIFSSVTVSPLCLTSLLEMVHPCDRVILTDRRLVSGQRCESRVNNNNCRVIPVLSLFIRFLELIDSPPPSPCKSSFSN